MKIHIDPQERRKVRKVVRYVAAAVAFFGFALILGAAGLSDTETADVVRVTVQAVIGCGMMVGGTLTLSCTKGGY